jgi:hypothetical protein
LSDKQFVFTDVTKKDLDSYERYIGRMLAHQSDREYHRDYFPDGVSSNTKKQGHEQQNVLLLILLYLCSDEGAELEDSMGQARLVCVIDLSYAAPRTLLPVLIDICKATEIVWPVHPDASCCIQVCSKLLYRQWS